MRKHYIEHNARQFIEINGDDSQIIVFGGGYDTMPIRLSLEFPNVLFFETDRGGTRDIKLEALEILKADVNHPLHHFAVERENLKFVEVDISDHDFVDSLINAGADLMKPTLFICEGLTMYLSFHDVANLLEGMHYFENPSNTLAISFMEQQKVDTWTSFFIKRSQEEYNLKLSPQEGVDFLNDSGFLVSQSLTYSQLCEASGLYNEANNRSIVTQFIASPTSYTPSQQIENIEIYELPSPEYEINTSSQFQL